MGCVVFFVILENPKLNKIGSVPTLAVVGTAIRSVHARSAGENGTGGEDQEMAPSYGVPGVVLDVRAQDPDKPGNFLLLIIDLSLSCPRCFSIKHCL